ncbi:arsenite methyltransferase [Candidatus Gracilibacteria bacterium]|nr:arsenite methyltransferase [Candidatus Gracilibacteria bacterium]
MSNITPDAHEIKAVVQAHYSAAIQSARGCCSPTSTELTLYGPETLAELPADVLTTSFGCGNAVALASLQPGETVIDLGSGGGLEVLLAAKRVGPEGFVYGLDMTDAMLDVARRNAAKADVANVSFLKGDIEAIPLPDQQIDVIMSNCVVNLAPDKGEVLHEAFRVLKPGGRLAISDIVFDVEFDTLAISEPEIRSALSWAGCFAGALTMAQYRSLLAAAGFDHIELAVTQRYSAADLAAQAPAEHAPLAQGTLAALDGRVTSCSITARRPALH